MTNEELNAAVAERIEDIREGYRVDLGEIVQSLAQTLADATGPLEPKALLEFIANELEIDTEEVAA